jgi:hypothetical protein
MIVSLCITLRHGVSWNFFTSLLFLKLKLTILIITDDNWISQTFELEVFFFVFHRMYTL